MWKTDMSTDCLDAINADMLFSSTEMTIIPQGLWDTYLNPDKICHVKEEPGLCLGSTRDDSFSVNSAPSGEDDSGDNSWISQEDDEILNQYTLALTMLEAKGEFSALLLEDDFPGVLFQDDTVDPLGLGVGPMSPDLTLPRAGYGDSGEESMQPLDYSLGSRLHDFLPPSIDDLPELKPCPIAAAENGHHISSGSEQALETEIPSQQYIPTKEVNMTKSPHRKTKRKLKDKDGNKRPRKKKLLGNRGLPQGENQGHDDIPVKIEIKREPDDQSTSEEDNLVINTEVCCNNNSQEPPTTAPRGARRPGRRPGQPSKVYHLWEFLRDLLQNADYCPTHVHWIDQRNGVFRIAKSEEVAQLWGQKKRTKRSMTYEKMSRAIRFSREAGYFGPLPKDGDYPKKLCFKFGPRACDWIDGFNSSPEVPAPTPKPVQKSKPTKTKIDGKETVHWKKLVIASS